ncbi:MAG: 4-(cytidine 5'-diphospho)-2-C-methyl-D-erythritol kinase [Idiomarina sp.]|nr:4-(cytidine 5'-diphospho)-2-C-methyl-D-erythritol kinase [Idiomarina sp.]
MVNHLTIAAPAKINLFLHITGRRANGYHELETLFQFIDLCDQLFAESTSDGHVTVLTPLDEVPVEDNLIYRAAQLLLPYRKDTTQGVRLTLQKKIPMGGGLGGGSSDAASTLIALNHLWSLGLSRAQLAGIGLQLGADVPVFVHGEATLARGVGEQFTTAKPDEAWYLLVDPKVHVSTAEVFNHPELFRASAPLELPLKDWQSYRNDCQPLVSSLYPQVAKAIDWLVEYAPTRMTGTGACVFGCFSSQAAAQEALAELPQEFSGFVTRGLNTSPAWQCL